MNWLKSFLSESLAERLPIAPLISFLRKKSVPIHHYSIWYYLGNALLTCLFIQIITGIILLFHYQPTPATAYESIRVIISTVKYGWLMRSIHKWGAYFMITTAWLHFFSTFFFRSYRRPRELIWGSGLILFTLIMMLGFSGYLLPWSEHAFFATRVGSGIAGQIPLIGHSLKIFLRGGVEIGDATLTRFFALHIVVLPLALLIFASVHLLLIQIHGLSVPAGLEKQQASFEQIPFFPEFILEDFAISCWIIASVVFFAVLFPCEIGSKYQPLLSAPESVLPEWYFLFMYKTLQMLPAQIGFLSGAQIGLMGFIGGFILIFLLPLLDRHYSERFSRFITISGILLIGFLVIMTLSALINYDTLPSHTEIDLIQKRLAKEQLPGLLIFFPSIIAFGISLWLKAQDYRRLRKQGLFFDSSSSGEK